MREPPSSICREESIGKLNYMRFQTQVKCSLRRFESEQTTADDAARLTSLGILNDFFEVVNRAIQNRRRLGLLTPGILGTNGIEPVARITLS